MLEVLIKQCLTGEFTRGTEVALDQGVQGISQSAPAAETPPVPAAQKVAEEIVMRKWSGERGMSLIEATIILMVLATLTAAISPSIADYSNEARQVKAKEDVEAIGTGLLRMLRDTGSRCVRKTGTTDCTKANRVDLLVSAGNNPVAVSNGADAVLTDAESWQDATTAVNWLPDTQAPSAGQRDTIDEQLILNSTTPYTSAGFTGGGGPKMKLGWRGAYLNGPISGDPWNHIYQADTIFLTVATDATDTAGAPDQTVEGMKQAGWKRNVLVVSAGGNGTVDTEFGGTAAGAGGAGVVAGGDDIIYVLRGSSR
jgi:type II secretory pathway pseudopilin PulG